MERCINPFNICKHKNDKSEQLRFATASNVAGARFVGIRLTEKMKLCSRCRHVLCERIKRLDEEQLKAIQQRPARRARQRSEEQRADQQQQIVHQAQEQLQERAAHKKARQRLLPHAGQLQQQQLLHRATEHQEVHRQKAEPMETESLDGNFSDPPGKESTEKSFTSSSSGNRDILAIVAKFNKILPLIGVTRIEYEKIGKSQSYVRNKLEEITSKIAKNVFDISPQTDATNVDERNDGREMVKQLKHAFVESTDRERKIKILSVLPKSWSARKVAREFNVSVHMALRTKELVEDFGILCGPEKHMASHVLPTTRVKLVEEFYLEDNISHPLPGKRDCITVNQNNEKVALQKRLILMNLSEAYYEFKLKYPKESISFSKFATLRPPQCVLALASGGTHSVCVCSYHQNVKLVFEPLNKFLKLKSYRDLFVQLIYAEQTENCKLNECDKCPGNEALEDFLAIILDENDMDNISYRQWINLNGKN